MTEPGWVLSGFGLVFAFAARFPKGYHDPRRERSWREPPRWARIMFGTSHGSVIFGNAVGVVGGLIMGVAGLAIVATGNPPGPPLLEILVGLWIAAFAGMVVGVLAVVVSEIRW